MQKLQLKSVTKHFGGVHAAQSVSFNVEQGSIHGLIGPNGSGKSTIFNCLTGVYPLTSGEVYFDNKRIDGKYPHQIASSGIARTFQNLRLFSGLTVLENILIGRHIHMKTGVWGSILGRYASKTEHHKALTKSTELANMCGLQGRENELSKDLPYGLQRRLEIARALAIEPTFLMLDEPAAGMNNSESQSLQELIHSIHNLGITILLIEHNVKLVMGICERITVMEVGSVIAEDSPENIVNNARVIEAYLGKEDD